MGQQVDRFVEQADYCVGMAAKAISEAQRDFYRRLASRYRGLAKVQMWLDRSDRDQLGSRGNDRSD
jgi:hypothetical protein